MGQTAHICPEQREVPGLLRVAERHDEPVAALLNLHGLVPAIVVANRLGVVSADVVDGPLIRVLARSLVLEEGEE